MDHENVIQLYMYIFFEIDNIYKPINYILQNV